MKRALLVFGLIAILFVCGCGPKETPPHFVELYDSIMAEANEDAIGITLKELQEMRPHCEKYKIAAKIDAKIAELLAEKKRIPEKMVELIQNDESKRFSALYKHTKEYFPDIDLTHVRNENDLHRVEMFVERKRWALAKSDLDAMDTSTLTEMQKVHYETLRDEIPKDPKLTNPLSITAYTKGPNGKYKKVKGNHVAIPVN